jgi:hypothetical protein
MGRQRGGVTHGGRQRAEWHAAQTVRDMVGGVPVNRGGVKRGGWGEGVNIAYEEV